MSNAYYLPSHTKSYNYSLIRHSIQVDITSSNNTLLGYKIPTLFPPPPPPLLRRPSQSGVSRPTLKKLMFLEQNFNTLEAQS